MTARFLGVLLSIMLTTSGMLVAQDNLTPAPLPRVILKELDPWLSVIGADSPSFVLYADGTIIYRTEEGFLTTEVDNVEDFIAETLHITDTFFMLQDSYDHFIISDQPSNTLTAYQYADGEESVKSVYVYGNVRTDEQIRDLTPAAFLRPFDAITTFASEAATPWSPAHFEVVVWEYDTSSAVPWLENFPGFDDSLTIQRESVTSLYIPFEEYDHFLEVYADESAIEIDGETYAFYVRFPFPHEYAYEH